MRLIDISKREIKTTGSTKHVDELLSLQDASILELRVSGDSSKVLMILNYPKTQGLERSMVAVWNIESDALVRYGLKEEPISIAWETSDSRMFGVLTVHTPENGPVLKNINLFFINDKNQIKLQDTIVDPLTE